MAGSTFSDEDNHKIISSYMEGYENGLSWPDKWENHGKPGGPWVYGNPPGSRTDKEIKKAILSRECNQAWRRGWRYGHSTKHKANKTNKELMTIALAKERHDR